MSSGSPGVRRVNDLWGRVRALGHIARLLAATAATGVVRHWTLAVVSLIVAFALWFVVEDIENPRVEATVPGEDQAPIPIEVVNVPEGLIVGDLMPVRVFVEARQEEIDDLRAGDFSATVDASDVEDGAVRSLPVTVSTPRRDIQIVRTEPRAVEVSVVAAVSRELPVTVVAIGELPSGFRQGLPEVDPPFVTVTGRAGLVESVTEVQAIVSISGLRNPQSFDVELAPRTSDGARVTVTLSQNRARVTIPVEEALLTRQIAVLGGVVGSPAPGYAVTNVSISPSPVEVTGPREIVEDIEAFVVEAVDVTDARAEVIESRELNLSDEVTAQVPGVFITVTIEAQEGRRTLRVSPFFEALSEGLAIAAGIYTVEVRIVGTEPDLADLELGDVSATISFAEASPGIAVYEAEVTVPAALEIIAVEPVEIELVEIAEVGR